MIDFIELSRDTTRLRREAQYLPREFICELGKGHWFSKVMHHMAKIYSKGHIILMNENIYSGLIKTVY